MQETKGKRSRWCSSERQPNQTLQEEEEWVPLRLLLRPRQRIVPLLFNRPLVIWGGRRKRKDRPLNLLRALPRERVSSSAASITGARLNIGPRRMRKPNRRDLSAKRLGSIYYSVSRLLRSLLNKPGLICSKLRLTVRPLISRVPHHTAAAASMYLRACVQRVHNLSPRMMHV